METITGSSNWKLILRREINGVVLLRAGTCDIQAALPDQLFGLPVTALGAHALAPAKQSFPAQTGPNEEALTITCGPADPAASWDNRSLRDLTLPASLERVGDYAFFNCTGLKTLRLHDHVTHWGGGALMNCRSLDTFYLTRTVPEQGPTLANLAGELSRELDVTIREPSGTFRLLFPEFTELYEENCPAHHFDYFISGAGYPYHHCFREKKLWLNEYDALWKDFLSMDHDENAALRLAWYRLRWSVDLRDSAADAYRSYLRDHAGGALALLLPEQDALPLLLKLLEPDREALASACALARDLGLTAALAVLLEEQHRRFPVGAEKRFEL